MTNVPQSVYKAYTRIGRMSSGPSETWEEEYPGNHDNVPVSEPWLIDENMALAVVTGRDKHDVDMPCCGHNEQTIPKDPVVPSDKADGCITTPMVKTLKVIIACILDATIEDQLKKECFGCEYDHSSQLQHSCLFEPMPFYFQNNFDKLVAKVKKPWLWDLLTKAFKAFGLKPNPVRIQGATDTIVSELQDEPCIREKLMEIKQTELGTFSNNIVESVQRDFWEVEQAMQEDLWGNASEEGHVQMTDV